MNNTSTPFITRGELYEKLTNVAQQPNANICFIFGAGASYGYTEQINALRPPIVSDLFSDYNPIVKRVIQLPKHRFILNQRNFLASALSSYDNDLEKYLSFLYNRNDEDDLFTLLLLYLQDIYSLSSANIEVEQNNYHSLILQLSTLCGKSPWSCLTFNYDTILEQSYEHTGRNRARKFNNFDSYVNQNPKILKMHGSINFYFRFTEKSQSQKRTDKDIFGFMMNKKSEITNSHFVHTLTDKPGFHNTSERKNFGSSQIEHIDTYNFPLMMVPIHGTKKPENLFFEEMINEAKKEIEKSSLVIAIGYNFGDELFMNEMKNIDLSKKDLILVGTRSLHTNPETHAGFKNALNVWKNRNIHIFKGDGFADFVKAIIKKQA